MDEKMDNIAAGLQEACIAFIMPMTLLINFSLFQYLLVMYYKRRKQYHGFLLLSCAFLGFVTLIPFASLKGERSGHMNDISETASIATFLLQITMVSRDVTKRVRIPILRYMMVLSELFTLFELVVVFVNILEVCEVDMHAFDGIDNLAENLSLAFIFFSRFYYLYIARGWRFLLDNKKLEIGMYLLFITHEYPFAILESETGISWEAVQALWHRLTMALCIGLTIKEKFRSSMLSKDHTRNTTTVSQGPTDRTISSFNVLKMRPAVALSRAVRPAPMSTKVVHVADSNSSSRHSLTSFRKKSVMQDQ